MNRRNFLSWFTLIGISSSLPFAIAACSESVKNEQAKNEQKGSVLPPSPENSPRSDGFVPVGSLAALKSSASGVISPPDISAAIVRNPAQSDNPTAVNPRCTHAGCTVEWHNNQKLFVCPCHHAQFDSKGHVVRGPAEKPLKTYKVKVEGDSLLVKLA